VWTIVAVAGALAVLAAGSAVIVERRAQAG
jgi:hypothetical protein